MAVSCSAVLLCLSLCHVFPRCEWTQLQLTLACVEPDAQWLHIQQGESFVSSDPEAHLVGGGESRRGLSASNGIRRKKPERILENSTVASVVCDVMVVKVTAVWNAK